MTPEQIEFLEHLCDKYSAYTVIAELMERHPVSFFCVLELWVRDEENPENRKRFANFVRDLNHFKA